MHRRRARRVWTAFVALAASVGCGRDVRIGVVVADGGGGDAPAVPAMYFTAAAPWNQDVSAAPVDPESGAVIAWLQQQGWGYGHLQIDFGIEVLRADAAAPMRTFTPTQEFYTPDCDHVPVPVPPGGAVAAQPGYACPNPGADCYLIVMHEPTRRLYEMWHANLTGDAFYGGCLAVWDVTRSYPPEGRGDNCVSADAAGLPIAPLLFSADEVAAGEIRHAIRFLLPTERMRAGVFVRPATRGRNAMGPPSAPPTGARLRLRADYPLAALPNEGARVVARAMQRYGMILAGVGNIALTAQSDRSTAARWSGRLDPQDLSALEVRDFELLDAGPRIPTALDCVRAP
jgi:hypothetical protein